VTWSRPNTTVSILTGTSQDDLGDVYDNATVAASGVPASILEQSPRQVYVPADGRHNVVRRYAARLGTEVSVTTADRIRDDRTGQVYVIDNVSDSTRVGERRLDLRRVT
jgi:hypothetical protein